MLKNYAPIIILATCLLVVALASWISIRHRNLEATKETQESIEKMNHFPNYGPLENMRPIALTAVTTGEYNTALGYQALQSNTTGTENTWVGDPKAESRLVKSRQAEDHSSSPNP